MKKASEKLALLAMLPLDGVLPSAKGKLLPLSEDVKWMRIRNYRDKLLAASDWTQLPDNGFTDAERDKWKIYRQSLRDLTTMAKKASDVIFPEFP